MRQGSRTKGQPTIQLAIAVIAALALVALVVGGCASNAKDTSTSSTGSSVSAADRPAQSTQTQSSVQTSTQSTSKSLDSLKSQIKTIDSSTSGDISVVFEPLDGSEGCDLDATQSHNSASMIKLAVLGAFLQKVANGQLSLDDTTTVKSSDIVGGDGIVQTMGSGTSLTWGTLATYMIADSDNTAANMIIDNVGFDAVNAFATQNNLGQTKLNRKMFDTAAQARGIENYTSAADVAVLLKMIYNGTFVNQDMSQFALNALKQQADDEGIVAGLPNGVTVANKTGTVDTARHDGGIIYAESPYILVVMTEGIDESSALSIIQKIARDTYDYES